MQSLYSLQEEATTFWRFELSSLICINYRSRGRILLDGLRVFISLADYCDLKPYTSFFSSLIIIWLASLLVKCCTMIDCVISPPDEQSNNVIWCVTGSFINRLINLARRAPSTAVCTVKYQTEVFLVKVYYIAFILEKNKKVIIWQHIYNLSNKIPQYLLLFSMRQEQALLTTEVLNSPCLFER